MYSNFQGEECNFFFEENEFFIRVATAKAIDLDHSSSEDFDHLRPELNHCCLKKYNNDNLTGQKWSTIPAFAIYRRVGIETTFVSPNETMWKSQWP